MKILLSSHSFAPAIGGTEEVSGILAEQFQLSGHEVRVVTRTPVAGAAEFPLTVFRQPAPGQLLRLVRWCDVFFHNSISLRTAWPLLGIARPWVVAHQTWLTRPDGALSWRDHAKRRLLRRARNISISEAVARSLGAPSVVIGNPYREEIFRFEAGANRDRELIFVGRLVSDKGADLLLEAMALLREQGRRPNLTIVGGGPEEQGLRRLAAALGLEAQVDFAGSRTGPDLAALLNRHRLLVVPSRWREPFGLVALEGIACGCMVVGSEQGGLRDAIGPCGATFPNGDVVALATVLADAMGNEGTRAGWQAQAPSHLARHHPEVVARAYLKVFSAACAGKAER